MIRRHDAERFLLISQHDHALLSGKLAEALGNQRFAPPDPRDQVIQATALHDNGWRDPDERPTLNPKGLPTDVFENPLPLSLEAWAASADYAEQNTSPYTALLVSLHGHHLSAFAAGNPHTASEVFELRKFQQREIERQERLRQCLGLRNDIPRNIGLAVGSGPAEDQLAYNFGVIQVADRISLGILCTKLVFPEIPNIRTRPQAQPMTLKLQRPDMNTLCVDPWPFGPQQLDLSVPCRPVPARAYSAEQELHELFGAAPIEHVHIVIRPGS